MHWVTKTLDQVQQTPMIINKLRRSEIRLLMEKIPELRCR